LKKVEKKTKRKDQPNKWWKDVGRGVQASLSGRDICASSGDAQEEREKNLGKSGEISCPILGGLENNLVSDTQGRTNTRHRK